MVRAAARASAVTALACLLMMPVETRADGPEEPVRERPLPDYDGRPDVVPGPDATDVLLWVPRILTAPLHIAMEYLVRKPLGFLLTELERAGVIEALFSSGSDVNLVPTLFYEFGLSPSVGAYATWNHFLVRDNRISVHAATLPPDWVRIRVRDDVRFGPELHLAARFEFLQRPDQLFEGIGHDATQAPRARFFTTRIEGGAVLVHRPWRASRLDYRLGFRSVEFRDRGWNGEPSILQVHAEPPIGFREGYEVAFASASLVLDTHEPRDELQTARFRAGAFVEPHFGFGDYRRGADPVAAWVRLGGELAGSTDFLGRGRVFLLRGQVALLAPIDGAPIPFTELLDAGGRGPLAGFVTGRLRGYSFAAVTLEYIWPVWALLDGSLSATVGNAFGLYFDDFRPERLRLSFRFGLLPRVEGEHVFELGVGFGTETFERGAAATSFRFTVGGRSGL